MQFDFFLSFSFFFQVILTKMLLVFHAYDQLGRKILFSFFLFLFFISLLNHELLLCFFHWILGDPPGICGSILYFSVLTADAMGVSTGALDCLPWTTLWITAKDNLFAIK